MQKGRFELIEHTADLAVRIEADDYDSLFGLAPKMLYKLIGEIIPDEASVETEEEFELNAQNWEELFHDWLAEILYWFDVREKIITDCKFEILKAEHLLAKLRYRQIDINKSKIEREIKAVTYHNLEVKEVEGRIKAIVVFDV